MKKIYNNKVRLLLYIMHNAGGKNTNINGLTFEKNTCIENKLIDNNFIKVIMNPKNKYGYYYELVNENNKIIYLTQSGFKLYFKNIFNINIHKHPDEAFIIITDNEYKIKILEKKNQNQDGSVEEKLKTGDFNKREYDKMINLQNTNTNITFIIEYAFCISKFLQNKFESNNIKYNIIKEIMLEDNINIFYGEDNNYLDEIYNWIIN